MAKSDMDLAGKVGHGDLASKYSISVLIQVAPAKHPAATYTLIYAFLTRRSHDKAAEAVKKAAKDIVVLKDGLTVDGPTLDEVVKMWKALTVK